MSDIWFCKRCKAPVRDAEEFGPWIAGRCNCERSPSPWQPLTQEPTHYCTTCHAFWRQHEDLSWSLCQESCGPCCDNVPMSDQIMVLP